MDEDKKMKFVRVPCIKMHVTESRRELLMRAVSEFVSDQTDTQGILPLPECLRRLHKMKSEKSNELDLVRFENKLLVASVLARRKSNTDAVKSELMADVLTGKMQKVPFIKIEGGLTAKDIKPKKRLSQHVIAKMKSAGRNTPRPRMLSSENQPQSCPRTIGHLPVSDKNDKVRIKTEPFNDITN